MSCCTTCGALTEAGAVGPQGNPGIDGTNGTDGADAYSITAANYTQPAVSATVSVTVDRTDWMAAGQNIYISTGGYYSISSITDGTHVVVTNLGSTGNAAPAVVVASGKKFTPSGPENPEAAMAANTLKGNATAGVATPTAIAVGANQFLARSSIGNISVKTLTDFALTILDDANSAATRTTLGVPPNTRSITGDKSITGGGDLSADRTLELDGDADTPGNSKYYGTDSGGTKGFFAGTELGLTGNIAEFDYAFGEATSITANDYVVRKLHGTDEALYRIQIPCDGNLHNLQVTVSGIGATGSNTYAIYKNGVVTALAVSINQNGSGSNTGTSISVTPTDYIHFKTGAKDATLTATCTFTPLI